jgi:hypothetical protein
MRIGGWIFLMVQESIKHFPIPLRKSLKAIAEGDFLVISWGLTLGLTTLCFIKVFSRKELR